MADRPLVCSAVGVAALALALSCVGCADRSTTYIPPDDDGRTWTTVTTPDGRPCDLVTWADSQGHRGEGFAAMDCQDAPR